MKTIFVKVNDQYAKRFQTRTAIVEEFGRGRCVVKSPVCEEAAGHISDMLRCSQELRECYPGLELCPAEPFQNGIRFPYIRGKNVGEMLLERAQAGGEEAVLSALDEIWDILPTTPNNCCQFSAGEDFELWFGKAPELEGLSAVRRCAFDFTPSNLLFPAEGKPVFIDYEWYLQFPVPVDLLKYHFLKCLYIGVPSIDCWLPQDKAFVCLERKSIDTLERCYTFFLNQLCQEPGGEPAMHRIKPRYLKRRISLHDTPGIQAEQAQKRIVFLEERLADRERGLLEKDTWIDEQAGQIRYLQEMAAEKEKALAEKDIALTKKDTWIDEQAEQIRYLQEVAAEKEKALDEAGEALIEQDIALMKKDAWIDEQAGQIRYLQEVAVEKEKTLVEKDTWIDEQAGQVRYLQEMAAEKEKTLVEKDTWIDELQQKIQEMQRAIAWHEDALQERETKLVVASQQLSDNMQQMATVGEEIVRLKAVCARDTAQMEIQRGQIHTLETKLDRIESTLVWRLTKPFHKDI